MSKGELGKRIKQKILDGEGKVSFAFGITPILEECITELLNGQPELSPQTIRWVERWFNKLNYNAKQTGPIWRENVLENTAQEGEKPEC